MNHHSQTPPGENLPPAYAKAFARLDEAISKANSPSDWTLEEAFELTRLLATGAITLEESK
jgi:hypothetical protein